VLSLGSGGSEDADGWSSEFEESVTLKMLMLLQEHGWDFTYGRDPVLILIEIEEYIQNGEIDES
jgi:hypothetical protein